MGLSRRFLNLIVDTRIPGSRSLSCIDLMQQDFFNTIPTCPPHENGSGSQPLPAADAGNKTVKTDVGSKKKQVAETSLKVDMVKLPTPIFNFRAAITAKTLRWSMDCFPLSGREVLCADQSGRSFLFDMDTRRVVTMPDLCKPKRSPLSLFIPSTDMDAHDGSGGSLFIMEGTPEQEWCSGHSNQFEAFIYRKHTLTTCRPLPPPPFIRDPKYWNHRPSISSYTVIGGGAEICISVEGVGTYCFDTVKHTWRHVGDWTLPFQGKVEYVPELKLWFGLSAKTEQVAVADLSVMDSQPQLLKTWMELAPRKEWWNTRYSQFVNLGSGKFCIARYFHTRTLGGFYGDYIYENHFTVLTGVEVVRDHDGNGGANSNDNGSGYVNINGGNGKVELQMKTYKSKLQASNDCSLIKSVF